jgi:hypothetical protein
VEAQLDSLAYLRNLFWAAIVTVVLSLEVHWFLLVNTINLTAGSKVNSLLFEL